LVDVSAELLNQALRYTQVAQRCGLKEWQAAGNAKTLPSPATQLGDVASLDSSDDPLLRDLDCYTCYDRAGNATCGGGGAPASAAAATTTAAAGVGSAISKIRCPQLSQHVVEVIVGLSDALASFAFLLALRHPERDTGQHLNMEGFQTTN
jgi:hypothetical protein